MLLGHQGKNKRAFASTRGNHPPQSGSASHPTFAQQIHKEEAIRLWDRADTRVVTTVKKELKQKIDNLSADEIPDFAESKAKREFYLAELAKLDVEEKKKQLVSVEDIKKSSFAKGRAIREALTNLADRLSHQLAGEDDATVIHQIINSEHKEALNNLAQL